MPCIYVSITPKQKIIFAQQTLVMTTTKQQSWSIVALKLEIKIFTPVYEGFNGTDLVHVFLHPAAA